MPRIHRPRRPTKKAILSLVGGMLVALSLPPWGLWPLALLGIIVFETALGEAPARAVRFRCGWMFGAGWFFPGLVWMWFLTAPGYLLGAAMFAALHGVAAMASPTGHWRVLGRPAAHTLVEALRFCFPFGGVPLASLAISQSSGPLVGVVRIGGPLLLTWLTFQIGFALAGPSPAIPQFAKRRRPNASGTPHGMFALLGVIAIIVIAGVAPGGIDTGRTLRIAAVQGGGPQGTHAIYTDSSEVLGRHLAAMQIIQPSDKVDLVVWPENVIDVYEFAGSPELDEVAAEAKRLNAPLAVGITEETQDNRFTNAQVVVSPTGEVISRYEKVRRVPFGEYMPMRGLLEAVGAPTDLVPRNAVAGTGPALLSLPDGTRVGVVISWEVFFAGRARDGVDHGGQVIINPTNGSSYTWTVLQTQQVASSRLRAIETGRWLVQVAPTGFSAFVSPDGDVIDRTSVSEQKVIIHDVALRTGRTWYVRLGDLPWVGLVALVFAIALVQSGWRPPRRRRAAA
ncbi:unannotated protein [freshwater metagenome]|uniref:Unannotated protein n=1 Tax=freshwater metagenome TaxID=449393 RepID=A0A6J7CPT7_9ZZZZ|nr:apolipoprotein N-acyltransferase [Actinomycetota bacterium]